jgi:hypothetical protein
VLFTLRRKQALDEPDQCSNQEEHDCHLPRGSGGLTQVLPVPPPYDEHDQKDNDDHDHYY